MMPWLVMGTLTQSSGFKCRDFMASYDEYFHVMTSGSSWRQNSIGLTFASSSQKTSCISARLPLLSNLFSLIFLIYFFIKFLAPLITSTFLLQSLCEEITLLLHYCSVFLGRGQRWPLRWRHRWACSCWCLYGQGHSHLYRTSPLDFTYCYTCCYTCLAAYVYTQ